MLEEMEYNVVAELSCKESLLFQLATGISSIFSSGWITCVAPPRIREQDSRSCIYTSASFASYCQITVPQLLDRQLPRIKSYQGLFPILEPKACKCLQKVQIETNVHCDTGSLPVQLEPFVSTEMFMNGRVRGNGQDEIQRLYQLGTDF